jgi:membrane protease YdiL (CAAX protease family)
METQESLMTTNKRIASLRHTAVVLVVLGGWAILSKIRTDQVRAGGQTPHRIRSYVLTILVEWALFAMTAWGTQASELFAPSWNYIREVVRDFSIAIGFWICSTLVLALVGHALNAAPAARNLEFLLPHGPVERALWVLVSVSAGICEEFVFRGYLQRQFGAITGSTVAGLLLSAAIFGACHAYQGLAQVVMIAIYGAMFGILAEWRHSLRPGIISHAWNDAFAGLVAGLR